MSNIARNRRSDEDANFYITLETALVENGMLDDYMYLRELKQRRLFLDEEVNNDTVRPIAKAILRYNREDKDISIEERQPILLYLNTVGGEVDSGCELIDIIVESKTPVYIINTGYCYSMGFLIYIAGDKRFATRNAKFLLHDGTTIVGDSSSKARDRMNFNDRIETRLRDAVLTWTKISKDEYDEHSRTEWYMFSDEAKSLGIVDAIVGVDCDIDSII